MDPKQQSTALIALAVLGLFSGIWLLPANANHSGNGGPVPIVTFLPIAFSVIALLRTRKLRPH